MQLPAAARLLWIGFTALALLGCDPKPPSQPSPPAPFRWENVAPAAGINFHHDSGLERPLDILRTTGSGLAWLDFDQDGWPDLFCVNGNPPGRQPGATSGHRLYRNRGNGQFEDVTERAGLRGVGQDGFGVAVGDYNGDGWPDLYLTCLGPNHLYRNRGDGTFEDVSRAAGVTGEPYVAGQKKWSTAAAWFDADGDQDLDLYVANYCRLDASSPRFCEYQGIRSACSPTQYEGQADQFYENQGSGRFRPSARFGIRKRPPGRGLGVLPFDADGDGRTDIFVANDGGGGFFFHNRGGGAREVAYESGLALDAAGGDPAGMGIDAADYDGDGHVDVVLANFQSQPTVLYRQQEPLSFRDVSVETALDAGTRGVLTFGIGFEDFDLDGQLELLTINGHVQDNIAEITPGVNAAQLPQLFTYQQGRFTDVSSTAGTAFQTPFLGRGAAFADYDRDGDVDVAVSVNGGATQLWRNDSRRCRWLQIALRGKRPNPEAVGAQVTLRVGATTQVRQLLTGRSYLSDSERLLTFGIGASQDTPVVEVRWPNGAIQRVTAAGVDQRIEIVQE